MERGRNVGIANDCLVLCALRLQHANRTLRLPPIFVTTLDVSSAKRVRYTRYVIRDKL